MFEHLQGQKVTKKDVSGIQHLNQLSKYGAHLRQVTNQVSQQSDAKLSSDLTQCDNLTLNMDL